MHLPAHPLWFWLLIVSPFIVWATLWAIAQFGQVSLKPLAPWLTAGLILSVPVFVGLDATDSHKALRLVAEAVFYTCLVGVTWIQRWSVFETLRGPAHKWYLPWSAARFSIPKDAYIVVRDMDSIAQWYVDKLGLRRAVGTSSPESGAATYRFKEDGKSIILITKVSYRTEKPLMLFTKKIGKMKGILSARGVNVGTIEQDRQGTRYFEIHDPEGNAIEVVEEPG